MHTEHAQDSRAPCEIPPESEARPNILDEFVPIAPRLSGGRPDDDNEDVRPT